MAMSLNTVAVSTPLAISSSATSMIGGIMRRKVNSKSAIINGGIISRRMCLSMVRNIGLRRVSRATSNITAKSDGAAVGVSEICLK